MDELLGCGSEFNVFDRSCSLLHDDFAHQSNAVSTLANRKAGPRCANGSHDQHATEPRTTLSLSVLNTITRCLRSFLILEISTSSCCQG